MPAGYVNSVPRIVNRNISATSGRPQRMEMKIRTAVDIMYVINGRLVQI